MRIYMRRIIPVLHLLAAFAAGASAQTSNVTATITDADSQTWNNGTYTISFVQPPNDATAPVWNGTLMTPSQKIYTGSLSGSGVLTVALPDNTFITPGGSLWLFVICPNATAQCMQISLKVSGASPDLSTTLSNATITPRFSALLNAFGYLDVEVTPTPVPGGQYFNVTNQVTRVWSGTAWANQGSGAGGTVTAVTGSTPIASTGGATPAISCPTCTTSAASVTSNVLPKGSGGAQGLANSSISDDGATVSTAEAVSGSKFTSTVATGTAPFPATSTTVNPNLNAALLNGNTFASPSAIGSTAPSTGNFTAYSIGGHTMVSSNSPTLSAGTIAENSGTFIFTINAGSGNSSITITLPSGNVPHGWHCSAWDRTTISSTIFMTRQTNSALSTTSCTIGNFTSAGVSGTSWANGDLISVLATAD